MTLYEPLTSRLIERKNTHQEMEREEKEAGVLFFFLVGNRNITAQIIAKRVGDLEK